MQSPRQESPGRPTAGPKRGSSLVPLLLAYLTAILITVAGYYLLRSLGVAEVHSATIPSSIAFLNIAPLNRAYRRGTLRELVMRDWLALPDRVVAPQSYVLDWPVAAGLGAAWLLASINVASLVGSIGVAWLGLEAQEAKAGGVGASLLVGLIAAFTAGRWIGTRTWEASILAVIGAVLVGRVGSTALATLMLQDADPEMQLRAILTDGRWWLLTLAWLVAAGVGLWRGRRLRSSAYVAFLASTLVPASREALVEMAYQEAQVLETESNRAAAAAGNPRRPWWHRSLW